MRWHIAVGAWAVLWTSAAGAETIDPLETWKRNHWGIESTAKVEDCLACHGGTTIRAHSSHPVDVDYATAASRPGASLRPLAEALRRGVLLADGKVHCFSCHDPRSPWQSHIAIPPGSMARSAVVPGVDSTYGDDRPSPLPGTDVSPTPLCRACHTYGD
jgi:hypothetical protein